MDVERRVFFGLWGACFLAILWQAADRGYRDNAPPRTKPKPFDPNAPAFPVDIVPPPRNPAVVGLSDDVLRDRGTTRRSLGEVEFSTGAIVAADPVVQPERSAFARKVPPGRYEVLVYEARERVALVAVRFAAGVPERWQMALQPGQDARTLKSGEIFGYPVDAGLGTLVDVAARDALLKRNRQDEARLGQSFNGYDHVVAAPLEAAGGKAVLLKPLDDDPALVPIVESGWGDGFYASYWGLDAQGEALVLVTDFGVLEEGDGREPAKTDQPPKREKPPE